MEGHDDLLKRCVTCPLPNAVYGDLSLPRSSVNTRQAIGQAQAQVVMAVNAKDCLANVRGVVFYIGNKISKLTWNCITYCVREIDCCGSSSDSRIKHLAKIVAVSPRAILC